MDYIIQGTTMQSLQLQLERGDSIYSEAGSLLSMSTTIKLETNFTGGIGGVFKRVITGNTAVLNHFKAMDGDGQVSFSARMPGHIVPLQMEQYHSVHVQRHSFLCAEETVSLDVVGNMGLTGFFGGNGLIYNKLYGSGLAFISVDGEVNELDLEQGETILVHPGHLAAYDSRVSFELMRLKGFKNMFLGGDGMFLVKLTGAGKVWLHTLSLHGLAEVMVQYMPARG
ncbi:MAG: TIGR00266 family protein [Bacillota bacterium]|nr:TIGR00266 family protein [Bacillota bacterium]